MHPAMPSKCNRRSKSCKICIQVVSSVGQDMGTKCIGSNEADCRMKHDIHYLKYYFGDLSYIHSILILIPISACVVRNDVMSYLITTGR